MDQARPRTAPPEPTLLDPIRWVVDGGIDEHLRADIAAHAGAVASGIDYETIARELVACIAREPSDEACG